MNLTGFNPRNMKSFFLFLFCFLSLPLLLQATDFDTLMLKSKSAFVSDADSVDYAKVVADLQQAVKLQPENPEAHYFLGYAYSRLNAKDGRDMNHVKLALTIKASDEFGLVTKLSPHYTGDKLALDPYSKISSEWGSLAMSYWCNNQPDSATWAFNEGRKRGGFSDFWLFVNKALLDLCAPNSILISSGDNFTIPLWYLHFMEQYRKDVSVVDVSLLGTSWYPSFLTKNENARFDMPKAMLDTVEYCQWNDSVVVIGDFEWIVSPSYSGQYLLRSDRLLLSMLQENKWRRDVNFTVGFAENTRLSLDTYLASQILTDRLNINNQPAWDNGRYQKEIEKILKLISLVNKNSDEEMSVVELIRTNMLVKIDEVMPQDKDFASKVFGLLNQYVPEKVFPIQDENTKKYMDSLREKL